MIHKTPSGAKSTMKVLSQKVPNWFSSSDFLQEGYIPQNLCGSLLTVLHGTAAFYMQQAVHDPFFTTWTSYTIFIGHHYLHLHACTYQMIT